MMRRRLGAREQKKDPRYAGIYRDMPGYSGMRPRRLRPMIVGVPLEPGVGGMGGEYDIDAEGVDGGGPDPIGDGVVADGAGAVDAASPAGVCGVKGFCCNFGPATSGWTVFDNDWTGSPIMPSDNPFKWRQFEPGLILLCVRWYLRYAVSYRDLEEMMRERGLCVDHTTIYRWVQRYAPEIDKRCRPFLRRTTDSYRIDETYVRVGGAWHYLYRGVDSNGDTLDFLLRATRDRNAAIAFFRQTVGASHTTPPRVVNVDKNPASPIAFEAIKHEGLFRPRSSLRQGKDLNTVIEPDHRFIKRRTRPMLGFKQFTTAGRTVRGIEMMHALRKGQARWMAKGDVVGQTRLNPQGVRIGRVERSTQRTLARDPKRCNRTAWADDPFHAAAPPAAQTPRPS